MKQTEEIKAMIREMMNQEMENYKEAVSNGEADETASPVVYTMLQVLLAFTRKDLKEGQYVFESVRFLSSDVRPAECTFHDNEGRKQLPVAWTYYDEITKGIEPWMISRAESAAWAWWPDKEEDNNKE